MARFVSLLADSTVFPRWSWPVILRQSEVPWRLNVEVICGSVPQNTGLRTSQKRTVSLSDYVLGSRNFCLRTDHGNSNRGWVAGPDVTLTGSSGLSSIEVRDSGDQVSTCWSTRASVFPYHMTKEFFRLRPTFPATWLCSYRKTGDFWLLVLAVSQ